MKHWEYLQGHGGDMCDPMYEPFGYLDGWFVSWKYEDGEVSFSIELDLFDHDYYYSVPKEEAERFIQAWLKMEILVERSRPLEEIKEALSGWREGDRNDRQSKDGPGD